ncbi:DUF320 domain-containing protein [Bailinhaonella thermotolerans]|uniref:DUF320 domain-containing protein n=1 Tax=Bailinhaonella thermotolerans TaxID=1070861 RepID=A0A3A4AJ19_9ACTN|nr:DUF320 domain-containing protein [Bailinhaonella thermotolerans]RJL26607.1 DUF320 domain-containing protein [Bailinhaonella thermotolerans]
MFKKLCVTGAVAAAAAGVALIGSPAQANDDRSDNWTRNNDSFQSGNQFTGGFRPDLDGCGNAAFQNGISASTCSGGSVIATYDFD